MATFIIAPARTVDIDINNISLKKTIDDPINFRITAEIEGLGKRIVVWDGEEAYKAAGLWTNESVVKRILNLLDTGDAVFI